MSTIRPSLPSFPAPLQPAQVPAARSDFFKAALDAVQAGETRPQARAAPAVPSVAAQEERLSRPGALLDIRV